MKERNDLTDALKEMMAPGPHLEPEEIAAYHDGQLSPEDKQRVQDHLVACRECSELLLDLEGLADPGFGAGEALPDRAGEQVWESIRKETRKEIQPSNVVPFRRETRKSETPRWLRTLAAMLLLSTMALSAWVATLRDRVKELSGPQTSTVLDLYPTSSVRGTTAPALPEIPEDAAWVTVLLRSPELPDFADYGVEIVRADGSVAWKKDGLKPVYNSFSLSLPRDWIGDLRFRLVGIGPKEERRTIGEYALPKGP
jgi:hypothetical protein